MVTYSEWRDDSVPTWQTSVQANSGEWFPNFTPPRITGVGYEVWPGASTVEGAWAGAADVARLTDGFAFNSNLTITWDNASGAVINAYWKQSWLPITRPATFAPAGTLPPTVYSGGKYVNPNVIGHEWEPETAAQEQRLIVALRDGGHWDRSDGSGMTYGPTQVYVKEAGPVAPYSVYDPGFMTASALSALPTLGVIEATSSSTGSVTIADPDIPLSGEAAMVITILDPYTQAQLVPEAPAQHAPEITERTMDVDLRWRATLQGLYAPRYRLIYAPSRIAHNRIVQRGNDGLGVTGGRRIIGTKTLQSSNRATGIR